MRKRMMIAVYVIHHTTCFIKADCVYKEISPHEKVHEALIIPYEELKELDANDTLQNCVGLEIEVGHKLSRAKQLEELNYGLIESNARLSRAEAVEVKGLQLSFNAKTAAYDKRTKK